jgi:hypothetical protein
VVLVKLVSLITDLSETRRLIFIAEMMVNGVLGVVGAIVNRLTQEKIMLNKVVLVIGNAKNVWD